LCVPRTRYEETDGGYRKALQNNDLCRVFTIDIRFRRVGLPFAAADCIYRSRFGCGSSSSMALVIPHEESET